MKKKYHVWLVVGELDTIAAHGDGCLAHFEYETEAERNAFYDGVQAMDGWSEWQDFPSEPAAKEYVKQCQER